MAKKCADCEEEGKKLDEHGLCEMCFESNKTNCIEHMAEDIEKGCTEGRSDSEFFNMSWELKTEIF